MPKVDKDSKVQLVEEAAKELRVQREDKDFKEPQEQRVL